MKLVHYSHYRIEQIVQTFQGYPQWKPVGLWVSDHDDSGRTWADVCADQSRPLGQFVYDVTLAEGANVLILAGRNALERFTYKYRNKDDPEFAKLVIYGIDWRKVAEEHHGVIITPYIQTIRWTLRAKTERAIKIVHRLMWQDGWDCASGCIWHPDAIAEITLRQEPPANPNEITMIRHEESQPCPTASQSNSPKPTRTTRSTARRSTSKAPNGRNSSLASARE